MRGIYLVGIAAAAWIVLIATGWWIVAAIWFMAHAHAADYYGTPIAPRPPVIVEPAPMIVVPNEPEHSCQMATEVEYDDILGPDVELKQVCY